MVDWLRLVIRQTSSIYVPSTIVFVSYGSMVKHGEPSFAYIAKPDVFICLLHWFQ